MTNLQTQLFAMQDLKYRDFHSKLIPDMDKEKIIGIRTLQLRMFARNFAKTEEAEVFLKEIPHTYYEEDNLHMMLVGQIKDYESCMEKVEQFLPYIDNWATCDLPLPKCFSAHTEELLPKIRTWITSSHTYTVRYGIGLLMRLYLREKFSPEYPDMVASVHSDMYYINMMIAWYFATALCCQWDSCIGYIEDYRLSDWVHNKTIQKAVESYRISPQQKAYLKTFRKKSGKRRVQR